MRAIFISLFVVCLCLLSTTQLTEARRTLQTRRLSRADKAALNVAETDRGQTLLSELASYVRAEQVKNATQVKKSTKPSKPKAPRVHLRVLQYVLSRIFFNLKQEDTAATADFAESRMLKRLLLSYAQKRLATVTKRTTEATWRLGNATAKIQQHSAVIPILESYVPLREQEMAEIDRQIANQTWYYTEEATRARLVRNNTRTVIRLLQRLIVQLNQTNVQTVSSAAQARFKEQLEDLRLSAADPYVSSLVESAVTVFLSNSTQQTMLQLRSLMNLLLTEVVAHQFHLTQTARTNAVKNQEILIEMRRRRGLVNGDIVLKQRHLWARRNSTARNQAIVTRESEVLDQQSPLIAVYTAQVLSLKNALKYERRQFLAEAKQRKEARSTIRAIRILVNKRDALTFRILRRLTKIEVPPLILRSGMRCCRLCGRGMIACGNKCIPMGTKCHSKVVNGCACNITPQEIKILQHAQ